MQFVNLKEDSFRNKVLNCYNKYLSLSSDQKIAIGIYKDGDYYLFGNGIDNNYMYDIGSISKTLTSHLVLKLSEDNLIDLNESIDKYIKLRKGRYPSINELLTHSAGYNNLTPIEITIPRLLIYNYSKKNIYDKIIDKDIIKCLERRNKHISKKKYGYSDFAYAVLGVLIERVTNKKFYEVLDNFIKEELNLEDTFITLESNRYPLAINKGKIYPFWKWNLDNPYIASGGVVSNIKDMLKYLSLEIESAKKYIIDAHKLSDDISAKNNILVGKGWHSYKKSDRLWHVGGVGTFRSSIIINRKKKYGVVVLGNTKGINGANIHYLTKMIYSELKIKKIKL